MLKSSGKKPTHMPYKKRHHHSNIIGARKAAARQSRFRWCRGLVRPIDVLIARRIWFHVVFLHIRHHLVRDFGKHFLGKHHLAAVQVIAVTTSDEFTERHKLSTDCDKVRTGRNIAAVGNSVIKSR